MDASKAREILKGYLSKRLRVEVSDGRIIEGNFMCTDRDRNIVLGSCEEFFGRQEMGRYITWSLHDPVSLYPWLYIPFYRASGIMSSRSEPKNSRNGNSTWGTHPKYFHGNKHHCHSHRDKLHDNPHQHQFTSTGRSATNTNIRSHINFIKCSYSTHVIYMTVAIQFILFRSFLHYRSSKSHWAFSAQVGGVFRWWSVIAGACRYPWLPCLSRVLGTLPGCLLPP